MWLCDSCVCSWVTCCAICLLFQPVTYVLYMSANEDTHRPTCALGLVHCSCFLLSCRDRRTVALSIWKPHFSVPHRVTLYMRNEEKHSPCRVVLPQHMMWWCDSYYLIGNAFWVALAHHNTLTFTQVPQRLGQGASTQYRFWSSKGWTKSVALACCGVLLLQQSMWVSDKAESTTTQVFHTIFPPSLSLPSYMYTH